MSKKHGPEAQKQWVHLTDDESHLFDQTNGLLPADTEAERQEGMSEEERIANAGAIGGIAQSMGNSFSAFGDSGAVGPHGRSWRSHSQDPIVSHPDAISLLSRFAVEDDALSRLHDCAFGSVGPVLPWSDRLTRFSVSWVGAFDGADLVGFVHAVWDGGRHAFLLDTAVLPDYRRHGVGRALVARLVTDVRDAGCEWLHVDYESGLRTFYEDACGFGRTEAGLLRLTGRSPDRPGAGSFEGR